MMRDRIAVSAVAIALLLLAAAPMAAAQSTESLLDGKVRAGDTVTVGAGETVDGDLYVFGGTVTVDGTVTGDLMVFGGQVDVGGIVGGDLLAAGGDVTLDGSVSGDVRAAGGQLKVGAEVGEDLVIAGGQVDLSGVVAGDVLFGAGQVSLAGDVGGDVLGSAGEYTRTGSVAGTEDVTIPEEPAERPNPVTGAIARAVSIVLFGLLMMWLAGRRTVEAADRLRDRWLSAAGWGLAFLIALIVVPIILLFGGILLAVGFGIANLGQWVGLVLLGMITGWVVIGFVAFVVLTFVAPVTVGTFVGKLAAAGANRFVWMLIGVLLIVALGLIPVLGGIVSFVVAAIGSGAWLLGIRIPEETVPEPAVSDPTPTV